MTSKPDNNSVCMQNGGNRGFYDLSRPGKFVLLPPANVFKKAQGCCFWSMDDRCDRTAPTPESESLTSTVTWRDKSGFMKSGLVV